MISLVHSSPAKQEQVVCTKKHTGVKNISGAAFMDSIKISGKLTGQTLPPSATQAYRDVLTVTYKQEVLLEAVRGAAKPVELNDLTPDTLLELEFEGGYKRWLKAADLPAQTTTDLSRDSNSGFLLTPFSFAQSQQRGALGLILKYVRVLSVEPAPNLKESLIDLLQTKQVDKPGLYRCANTNLLQLDPLLDIGSMDTRKPILLFIHGTFSNTDGSFGELWESRQGYNAPAYLQRLFAPYGKQVLALEHHTMTESPIQNALEVARRLPMHSRVHIISHSRGGLVGELLCQGRLKRRTPASKGQYISSDVIFAEEELATFADNQRQLELQGLQELGELLRNKSIQIERFVRVACPGRGTVLATERLEDSISLICNVLNFIPSQRLQRLSDYLRTVLMAVIAERRNPATLPGLEALMPTSPLIRLLNRSSIQLDSDLSIIAGNVKASSLLGQLKQWATNRFFGEDNDYVVNTAGMYGGAQRLQGMRFYLDQRDDSSHFSYFRDAQVRERILNALQQPDSDTRLRPLYSQATPSQSRSVTKLRPEDKTSTLYFLPGFMGSTLQVNGQAVWLDMATLSWGDFATLQMQQAGVKAEGLLELAYRPLLDLLDDKHRVVEFAYDWRRSFLDAGRRLGEALERELDEAKAEGRQLVLRLLAHSSGGLVVLAMLSEVPDVWQRLREEAECRCVLLGTPLNGTYTAVQLLSGQHRLLSLLNLLDGKLDAQEGANLVTQFASYPGVLELLPPEYLQEDPWQALLGERFANWSGRELLANAQQVREQLSKVDLDAQRFLYVHGRASLTPNGLKQRDNSWQFSASAEGDSVTLWNSVAVGLPAWYMPVEHGRMASHPDYFQTIQYLLDDGVARQLEQSPPFVGNTGELWLPVIRTELFPDADELVAAALGYHTRLTQEEVRPAVEIRVWHGNLEYAAHPVVVGHYEGDSILSAESVIDRALEGRLSELLRLGLYPGALGTSHVFLNPGKRPAGAVVIGLGEVGKLTSGLLTTTYTRGLLDYCLQFRDKLDKDALEVHAETAFIPVHIASLLVGTVGGGSISLGDSLTAILRAVSQTNLALDKAERGIRLRIQLLDFIELYEDRAVEAARLIQDFISLPEFRADFTVKCLMQTLPGNRRRVMYNDPPGWWRRVQITADRSGLKYNTLTDKARAELTLQATQRKLVDQFIEKAVASSHDDPDTGKILFELLLPPALKDQAPNTENLVLVLDEEAAGYPWELLYNRLDVESQPLAVRIGVLRQLQVGQYRQQVVTTVERSALVIGDPPVDGNFMRLEAAKQEAMAVANLLEAGGFSHVVREIGTDAQAILKSLHSHDYQILHLAGHGVYRYQADEDSDFLVTGMVLGNGIFLTPVEIGQMRKVPELAFINCCHLAKLDQLSVSAQTAVTADRVKLAASLAQELISMGVRAVIAAGWAIDDAAAKVFAESCYTALLKGHPFGDAVLMARWDTWQQHADTNTWGAYQCYGDPDYKLMNRRPHSEAKSGDDTHSWRFVAEVEVSAALQNLVNAAENAQVEEFQSLKERLQRLHRSIPAEWLNHASILYEIGSAYGKLDMFAEAIDAYNAALDAPQADYPVVLLEDKISLQTAWALAWFQGKATAPETRLAATPADLMQQSLKILHLLDKLGNSLQRFEDEGKFWKRQAMMLEGHKRNRALQAMEAAYKKAHEFAMQKTNTIIGYSLINWLTARVVRYLRGNLEQLDRQELKYWLDQSRQSIHDNDKHVGSFLTGITRAEYTLLLYLIGARLDETTQLQAVLLEYETAMGRGASPRQLRYIAEHLTFLQLMLQEQQTDKPQLQPVVMALLEVQGKLGV